MAEEHKTEETQIEENNIENETQVTISQDKLNSLINEKYKKGAEKANAQLLEKLGVDTIEDAQAILAAKREADEANKSELEKATENITALTNTINELQSKLSTVEADKKVASLAAQHGIKEVDYFKYEYNKASQTEDFDESAFIANLLETKGGLLKADTSATVVNPKNVNSDHTLPTISMKEYSLLSSADRAKYKASQITKD